MEPRALEADVRGAGPPVVLLPGGLTGWLSWVPHQEALASDYTAIRLQPIHNELGSRGVPGDLSYTATTEVESIGSTLDALEMETAHLAGWSRGAADLVAFAVAHGERVRSLTLIEPPLLAFLRMIGDPPADASAAETLVEALAGRDVTEDELGEFLILSGVIPEGADFREHPNWERWIPHRMALSWPAEVIHRPPWGPEDLAEIEAPTLLVEGTATVPWQKRVVESLADRIPHATLLRLEGGHACHIQSMEPFLEAVRAHLRAAE